MLSSSVKRAKVPRQQPLTAQELVSYVFTFPIVEDTHLVLLTFLLEEKHRAGLILFLRENPHFKGLVFHPFLNELEYKPIPDF